MSAASRYWTFVRIDAAGKRKIEEIAPAKAFFLASFPEFVAQSEVSDIEVQRQLLFWMQQAPAERLPSYVKPVARSNRDRPIHSRQTQPDAGLLARCCLKCFISHSIDRVCRNLSAQFGTEHGFTSEDLLPFVLDEDIWSQPGDSPYQSLMSEILHSFDPEQSSLATWTTRRVKHDKELNTFLLERGVYLVSDWAILNDTRSKQLQRILLEFHHLSAKEIQQARGLLESYHAVYRAQRLKQRQAGIRGKCQPPTREQLQQIARRLSGRTAEQLSPEAVMSQLQDLASQLREYRIYVRGGAAPAESIDAPDEWGGTIVDRIPADSLPDTVDEEAEFLDFYRQQFRTCLDQTIAKVTQARVNRLIRKNPEKAEHFLLALYLFHCQGKSMGEIAQRINYQAQYQVTRLLQLKAFRADIQQQLLLQLCDRVLNRVKPYTNPQNLQAFNRKIEAVLNEQVKQAIQEAAAEASTTKPQPTNSLFSERLCHHLDTRSS
jgi:hypothetical protein